MYIELYWDHFKNVLEMFCVGHFQFGIIVLSKSYF